MTGTGFQEWSRQMVSVSVDSHESLDDSHGTTRAVLGLKLGGDGSAQGDYTIKRKVWADDKYDLNSPLHYRTWVYRGHAEQPEKARGKADKAEDSVRKTQAAMDALGPTASITAIMEHAKQSKSTVMRNRRTLRGRS